MILQAYDFLELSRRFGCALQMGGSDQWGNIVNGVDLTRRCAGRGVFGLTSPLITTADGRKMGKTADGAVWLDGAMLGNFDFWQFWRNTADADIGHFLRLFSEQPLSEIARLEQLQGAELNEAKILLAREATTLARGADAADEAAGAASAVFGSGADISALEEVVFAPGEIAAGISAAQLLVRMGLAPSGKEARRLISAGGARLDDKAMTEPGAMITAEDFGVNGSAVASVGRKRHKRAVLREQDTGC